MNVRPATTSDRDVLLGMVRAFQEHLSNCDSTETVHPFDSDADVAAYLDQMESDAIAREGFIFVADSNDEVVGFVSGIVERKPAADDVMYRTTHGPSVQGWVGLLFVIPERRGEGIARRLMDSAKQYFVSQGCDSLHLLVAHDNSSAVEVYRRYGLSEREIEMAMPLG